MCPWAAAEAGIHFCAASAGAEFAPFFPEHEVKGWQVHKCTSKITMFGLLLVGFPLSSAFCQPYSGGVFAPPAPKRSELGLIILKGSPKPVAI